MAIPLPMVTSAATSHCAICPTRDHDPEKRRRYSEKIMRKK
jgi:hypothetical protein